MVVYLGCLIQLTTAKTARQAFYFGLGAGLLCVGPQLLCFWKIFGPVAVSLWTILAFWIALFVAFGWYCRLRLGQAWGLLLLPVLWTGLEYFRSELYYLRFSWLNVGYALSGSSIQPALHWVGVYGAGFVAMSLAALLSRLIGNRFAPWGLSFLLLAGAGWLFRPDHPIHPQVVPPGKRILRIAGVQLEFPSELEVLTALDRLAAAEPDADLLMLSEYTFDRPIPAKVLKWCRDHKRYLVVGGEDPAPKSNFYDTAFVIGTSGDILFKQVKAVPIQFFKDGLPATEQKVWESPWGKLGLCVCYDLSYTRVTDRLVSMGAEAILVPTMDVADWGRRQHVLHSLVAPTRAAEYGLPVFRLASSGISQSVDGSGQVQASAGYPGVEERIAGRLTLAGPGRVPMDRWLAPMCSLVCALLSLGFAMQRLVGGRRG
jgi:apolipoprotein N-acyltransferase